MRDVHPLRYGNNPHQKTATFEAPAGSFNLLNGEPSYINLLDVLTGWQMTRDLWLVTGQVAAVSMKHCVPVGLAGPGVVDNFSGALLRMTEAESETSAYLRARSSDWGAAYGDIAVIFGTVGEELASLLARLVSDGIAATGYTDEALRILQKKRNGQYLVIELDGKYSPPSEESREVMGLRLVQERNDYLPSTQDFDVVVGSEAVAMQSIQDLMLSAIAMKYTVSNNIVIASGSRSISISAGQQSRILSTRLACFKFKKFMQLQHPQIVEFVSTSKGKLTDRIAKAVNRAGSPDDDNYDHDGVILLASDGFIPFTDNIEEVAKHGIEIVCEPDGAMRRIDVENAAAKHGITLVRTQKRFFYH